MSATASDRSSLEVVLRRAGAVVAMHGGRPIAAHFGSAAAELAVCVRAVGLVDRSDLSTLALAAPPAQLAALTSRLAGATVSPGGLVSSGPAWWCGEAPDRVTVVSDSRTAGRLVAALRAEAARHLAVCDRSGEMTAIELLGPATARVLAALGVYGASGDPRRAKPFEAGSVAGIPAWWLLHSDRHAVALVAPEWAGEAWLALERAGRPFGISCVGHEAARRYAVMERLRALAPAAL